MRVKTSRYVFVAMLCASGLSCGKGSNPNSLEPSNPQEDWALSETVHYASMLGKDIIGKITSKQYEIPPGQGGCPKDTPVNCEAAAWFETPHIVWYQQQHIDGYSMSLISDIAAHEVCHSISLGHDWLHYNCILSLGRTPTYAINPNGSVTSTVPF